MHRGARTLTVLALALLASPAQALRCGGDLVREGDREFEVRRACGEPDWISAHHLGHAVDDEVWHYNFGPSELIRVLHFRGGRLRRIETAGRGFRRREGPGTCRPPDVLEGMTASELLQRCGEPVQRERGWHVLRVDRHGHLLHGKHPRFRRVFVEDWFYDFGGGYLPRRLRLVDGIVAEIETAR